MRNKSGDKARLDHIFEAITEIENYINNVDFDSYLKNSMMRFLV